MYSTRKGSNFEENVPVCFGEILCLFDMFLEILRILHFSVGILVEHIWDLGLSNV